MSRFLFSALLCCAPLIASAQVPLPASLQSGSGKFVLKANDAIQTNSPVATKEAEKFAAALRVAAGLELKTGTAQARIRIGIDESLKAAEGEEGYKLSVTPDTVQLTAATASGLYHGIQTLRQLLPPAAFSITPVKGVEWSIGSVKIDDKPRFGWRGFMLDESRHFFGAEYVKHLLDAMAARKLNVFHWHLSDDDGWRIEIKSWPKLTEVGAWRGTECPLPNTREGETHKRYGGFYTREQIKEIVAYAAERHIDIMPEIDMPGHCLAVTTAYPETQPTTGDDSAASVQGVKGNVLSAAREENYKMIDDIFREVSELFPFQYIHIGGDEVNHAAWSKDPAIKALMERENLHGLGEVQGYFTRRLETIIGSHHRRLIGWNEILGGGKLLPDTTVMSWTGTGPGFDAARKGHPVVMAPGPFCYFDMGYGGPDEPKGHSWAGMIETSKTYSFDPTAGGNLNPDQQARILGPHAAMWSEYVTDAAGADYKIFPRLNALAEVGWTPQEARNWDDFAKRLGADLERMHYQGVAFRVPPPTALWKQGKAKLVAPFPGADLHFTTDGSKPTAASPKYDGLISISDPGKLRYVTIFHDRTSPAKSGAEREAFAKWTPENVTADFKATDFDASTAITGDGIHRAVFQHTGGKKLVIRKVELLRDGKVIATDTHDGEAVGRGTNTSYRLPVTGHHAGAKYLLRAEIKGDGGNDSRGGISLDRSEGLEPAMKVETAVSHYQDHSSDSLATWNPEAYFWSDRPLAKDETITFTFEKALPLRHVELPTGEASGTKDQIQNAVLEVSADGKVFRKVADYTYGTAKADLDGKPVLAIRLRVTGPNHDWCIVRAPELK